MYLDNSESQFTKAKNILIPELFNRRHKTDVEVVDYMFGGGILPGFTFTLKAPPGAGKSTWMLQLFEILSKKGISCGYCAGEESVHQLAFTCKRLDVKELLISNKTDYEEIADLTREFNFICVDSFQSMTTKKALTPRELERAAVLTITKAAKQNDCAVCFIMHITKNNQLKGSTTIPHTVDGNLNIEVDRDMGPTYRKVFFSKNRFGPIIDIHMHLTGTGFQWTNLEEATEQVSVQEEHMKLTGKDKLKLAVLALGDTFTAQQAIKVFSGDWFKTQCTLREMTIDGKLEKLGRGQEAIWKRLGNSS